MVKNVYFVHIFRNVCKKKDGNIHLNYIFPKRFPSKSKISQIPHFPHAWTLDNPLSLNACDGYFCLFFLLQTFLKICTKFTFLTQSLTIFQGNSAYCSSLLLPVAVRRQKHRDVMTYITTTLLRKQSCSQDNKKIRE